VVRPAFRRRSDLVVAIEEADPVAGGIAARDADQFRAETGNDETESVRLVGQNIEQPIAPLFFAPQKGHRWITSAVILLRAATARQVDRRYRLREQTAGVLRLHDSLHPDGHRGRPMRNLVRLCALDHLRE
jgi:transcriptional regulator of aromatic amino acid metabolism